MSSGLGVTDGSEGGGGDTGRGHSSRAWLFRTRRVGRRMTRQHQRRTDAVPVSRAGKSSRPWSRRDWLTENLFNAAEKWTNRAAKTARRC